MAEFLRLSAADADTELREMRHALLQRVASLENKGGEAVRTRTRIAALNRALQSLSAEKGAQAVLLTSPPTAYERPRID